MKRRPWLLLAVLAMPVLVWAQQLSQRQWDYLASIVTSSALLSPDGSSGTPVYSFRSAASAGLYQDTSGPNTTVKGKDGSGTNQAGQRVSVRSGRGTGTGASGNLSLQFAPRGSSGTSLNAWVSGVFIDGGDGATNFGGANLSGTPGEVLLIGHGRVGTNLAGGIAEVRGGLGTGTGVGGGVRLSVAPAGASGTSQNTLLTAIDISGTTAKVQIGAGTDPSLSACGSGPAFNAGGDQVGQLTTGSGATLQSCTVTFSRAFASKPACFANDETTIMLLRAVSTTTTLTIDCAVAGCLESEAVTYWCLEGN
jgi:hypothetical protein